MRYSLLAGGKRLRPILCLASADAVGGRRNMALPAACAIELIHTYSLIHDDLPAMDNDVRRGRPTLHVVAGEGMAILAGDGLLTEAFHILARQPVSADARVAARKLRVIEIVAHAAGVVGMVGGQAIDLASVARTSGQRLPALDAAGLRAMHARKTEALIRASAVSGAIMGGGSEDQVAAIDALPPSSAWRFRSSTIFSTSRVRLRYSVRRRVRMPQRKPTYPALYGLGHRAAWRPNVSTARRARSARPASTMTGFLRLANGSSIDRTEPFKHW